MNFNRKIGKQTVQNKIGSRRFWSSLTSVQLRRGCLMLDVTMMKWSGLVNALYKFKHSCFAVICEQGAPPRPAGNFRGCQVDFEPSRLCPLAQQAPVESSKHRFTTTKISAVPFKYEPTKCPLFPRPSSSRTPPSRYGPIEGPPSLKPSGSRLPPLPFVAAVELHKTQLSRKK